MDINFILNIGNTISGVLGLILALLNFKLLNRDLIVFGIYLLISSVFNVISEILYFNNIRSFDISNFYNIFEYSFILFLYFNIFKLKFSSLKIVLIYFILVLLHITLLWYFKQSDKLEYTEWAISNIILILFFLAYIYQQFNLIDSYSLFDNPLMWINVGFLIYFAGTFFLFLVTPMLYLNSKELSLVLWQMNNVLVIIANFIFIFGLWKTRKCKVS